MDITIMGNDRNRVVVLKGRGEGGGGGVEERCKQDYEVMILGFTLV